VVARKSLPPLSPKVLVQDQALAKAIDEVLAANSVDLQQRVAEARQQLQTMLTADQWEAYLAVEQAVAARWAEASVTLVVWAFNEGQKNTGPRR